VAAVSRRASARARGTHDLLPPTDARAAVSVPEPSPEPREGAVDCDLAATLARVIRGMSPDAAALLARLTEGMVKMSSSSYPPARLSKHQEASEGPRQDRDNLIVDDRGSSTTTEEPMFSWIAPKPYAQHRRFRVWVKTLDGARRFETFENERDALVFIEKAQAKLLKGGNPVEDVIAEYLRARAQANQVKDSTLATLRFRLRAIIKNRSRFPVEAFPWAKAWDQHIGTLATDTQYGVRSALEGLITWAVDARILRRPPDLPVPRGKKKRGKTKLRIDGARAFLKTALTADDPLSVAAATMLLTGIRPGEAMTLRVRDLDDGGQLLWVASDGGKTEASDRQQEVPAELQPYLLKLAKERGPNDWLFTFEPQRRRKSHNEGKGRRDALLRRVKALCQTANVPVVVSHSMRGLHAKLATERGTTSHVVAAALGHRSFATTAKHYIGAEAVRQAATRKTLEVLRGSGPAVTLTASEFTAPRSGT
jgi:integrase